MTAPVLALSLALLTADLPPESTWPAADASATPRSILDAIVEAGPRYRFDAGALVVETDRRWFQSASGPGGESPVLELRRWPGDSVLALFAVEHRETPAPPALGAPFVISESKGGIARWTGSVTTEAGPRRASWLVRSVGPGLPDLAALAVPGDAGLGEEAIGSIEDELEAVFARVEVRVEAWRFVDVLPPASRVALPALDSPPRPWDEGKDPWQVIDAGLVTLGLPPGLRARRVDAGVPAPRPVPGATLWIRGRFRDRDGGSVIVGDGLRAGYLTVRASSDRSRKPPSAVPGATFVDALDLGAIAVEDTGASSGRVERWDEAGFAGTWLVFRLFWPEHALELGLPVIEGRRSLALFWVPATVRPAGQRPAPPPIDPAERFGIRFERLGPAERRRQPFVEGFLSAPRFRVELPRGAYPIAALRTSDGFPVTLIGPDGVKLGTVAMLVAEEAQKTIGQATGWVAAPKPERHRARAVWSRGDGAKAFIDEAGTAVVIEPDAGVLGGHAELWMRMLDTVELRAPRRPAP